MQTYHWSSLTPLPPFVIAADVSRLKYKEFRRVRADSRPLLRGLSLCDLCVPLRLTSNIQIEHPNSKRRRSLHWALGVGRWMSDVFASARAGLLASSCLSGCCSKLPGVVWGSASTAV